MLTGKLFGGERVWGGGEPGLVLTFGRRPDQKRVVFTKTP